MKLILDGIVTLTKEGRKLNIELPIVCVPFDNSNLLSELQPLNIVDPLQILINNI
jgi:hypothetical protein